MNVKDLYRAIFLASNIPLTESEMESILKKVNELYASGDCLRSEQSAEFDFADALISLVIGRHPHPVVNEPRQRKNYHTQIFVDGLLCRDFGVDFITRYGYFLSGDFKIYRGGVLHQTIRYINAHLHGNCVEYDEKQEVQRVAYYDVSALKRVCIRHGGFFKFQQQVDNCIVEYISREYDTNPPSTPYQAVEFKNGKPFSWKYIHDGKICYELARVYDGHEKMGRAKGNPLLIEWDAHKNVVYAGYFTYNADTLTYQREGKGVLFDGGAKASYIGSFHENTRTKGATIKDGLVSSEGIYERGAYHISKRYTEGLPTIEAVQSVEELHDFQSSRTDLRIGDNALPRTTKLPLHDLRYQNVERIVLGKGCLGSLTHFTLRDHPCILSIEIGETSLPRCTSVCISSRYYHYQLLSIVIH